MSTNADPLRQKVKRRRAEHVVMCPPLGYECLRCGQTYQMTSPCPIDIMVGAGNAFLKMHRYCRDRKKA